jgi:hypothetical protein
MATNFTTAAGTNTVGVDALSSKGAVSAPSGVTTLPQIVNATGSNSQSGATAVVPGNVIVVLASATTRAIRLSVMTTGAFYEVFNDTATAMKVYPGTNGTIGSLSTNTALSIAARKATEFYLRNKTHVVTQVGA